MGHPRERRIFSGSLSRRDFLKRSAGTAFALSGAAAILEACGKGTPVTPTSTGFPLARLNNPVKWPIFGDNKAIADGLQPEQDATLKLYNWDQYIYKKVLRDFLRIDDRFSHCHWLFQMGGGVFLPPWGKAEQWMLSVQHGSHDVQRFLDNFARFARALRS